MPRVISSSSRNPPGIVSLICHRTCRNPESRMRGDHRPCRLRAHRPSSGTAKRGSFDRQKYAACPAGHTSSAELPGTAILTARCLRKVSTDKANPFGILTYFSELSIVVNSVLSLLPSPFTTVMIASENVGREEPLFNRGCSGFIREKHANGSHPSTMRMRN